MEVSKGMFLKKDGQVFKVLAVEGEKMLVIDCVKRGMPKWIPCSVLSDGYTVTDVTDVTNVTCVSSITGENDLSATDKVKARQRYSLIAGILPFIADDAMRNEVINRMCEQSGISRRTITQYLCEYLVYEDIGALMYSDVSM